MSSQGITKSEGLLDIFYFCESILFSSGKGVGSIKEGANDS